MTRLAVEDLEKIKEKTKKENALSQDGYNVQVTVHMATCGIAAGADKVFEALNEEIKKSERKDIKVVVSGCAGMCSSEPNITVRRIGEDAVLYRDLDAEKMREIFQGHVLKGEIRADYALARIR